MRRSANQTACRLASNFHQRLNSPLSQPARATCAEMLSWPRRIADEKTMLHLGDDLAGDFQLGRDAIDAVGGQPDDRLGNNGGWVELIRNRDPIVAAEATLCEPATDFPPRACLGARPRPQRPRQGRAPV